LLSIRLCDHAPIYFCTGLDTDLTIGDIAVYVCTVMQLNGFGHKHITNNAPAYDQTLCVDITLYHAC